MQRSSWRRGLIAAAGLVLVTAVTGFEHATATTTPPDDSTPAVEGSAPDPAEVSGTLTWYTLYASESTEPFIAAFNEVYPDVDVEVLQFGSAEMIERVQAEFQSEVNAVDVMTIVIGLFADPLVEAGIVGDYSPPSLGEYSADLAAEIHPSAYTAMGVNPHAICINTELVTEPPTSYEDLTDPRFRGLITTETFLSGGGSRNWMVEMEGYLGHEAWDQFMRALAEQDIIFNQDPRGSMDLLERGEAGVDPYCNATLFAAAVDRGAPIDWIPVNPNIASFINIMMATEAPNPLAAQSFINWTLSADGQAHVGTDLGLQPVQPEAVFPDFLDGMQDVDIVVSPSEFQLEQLGGLSTRDPEALAQYADYAREVFGLR